MAEVQALAEEPVCAQVLRVQFLAEQEEVLYVQAELQAPACELSAQERIRASVLSV
jgi:hypothetical protein